MPVPSTPIWKTTFMFRCPHCGTGSVFAGRLRERSHCEHCAQPLGNDRGNFLGALIINHFIAAFSVVFFVINRFRAGETDHLVIGSLGVAVVSTIFVFPFAKAFWVAICTRLQANETLLGH